MASDVLSTNDVIITMDKCISLMQRTRSLDLEKLLEELIYVNSRLEPDKRVMLDDVINTQKKINAAQNSMRSLVTSLDGLADSSLEALESLTEDKTIINVFLKRLNDQIKPEAEEVYHSIKDVTGLLENVGTITIAIRSSSRSSAPTLVPTTRQTVRFGSFIAPTPIILVLTGIVGITIADSMTNVVRSSMASIGSSPSKIFVVISLATAVTFVLSKLRNRRQAVITEPREDIAQSSSVLFNNLEEIITVSATSYADLTEILRLIIKSDVVDFVQDESGRNSCLKKYFEKIRVSCSEYLDL